MRSADESTEGVRENHSLLKLYHIWKSYSRSLRRCKIFFTFLNLIGEKAGHMGGYGVKNRGKSVAKSGGGSDLCGWYFFDARLLRPTKQAASASIAVIAGHRLGQG